MASYEINHLSFTYAMNTAPTLHEINLSIPKGTFMLLVGSSGSGKSTLLRQLKKEIAPEGTRLGSIEYDGVDLNTLDPTRSVTEIGMVFQDPDQQIVMSTVYEELAFGMENLGFPTEVMQRRIAEISTFFGMGSWLYHPTHALSGGQKQLLNLASVMTLRPKVLLLDEPTSQLDPLATTNFLNSLKQLNEELGITIILSEHRLENVLPLATHVTLLKSGRLIDTASPENMIREIYQHHQDTLTPYIPPISRLYLTLQAQSAPPMSLDDRNVPLTAKSFKYWLDQQQFSFSSATPTYLTPSTFGLTCKSIYFQYEKKAPFILEDVSLAIPKGYFTAILGGNGSGKSTFLKVLASVYPLLKGTIKSDCRIGYLPQNPRLFFNQITVGAQIEDTKRRNPSCDDHFITQLTTRFHLDALIDRHPYDLSGGEMQKLALLLVLIPSPQLLLLDEPTKGLDPVFKETLASLFKELLSEDMTLVMVSHDMDFVAKYTDFTTLMFSGKLLPLEPTGQFFEGNTLYTTPINRAVKNYLPYAITLEDVINHVTL